jgi:hypothetical protein
MYEEEDEEEETDLDGGEEYNYKDESCVGETHHGRCKWTASQPLSSILCLYHRGFAGWKRMKNRSTWSWNGWFMPYWAVLAAALAARKDLAALPFWASAGFSTCTP